MIISHQENIKLIQILECQVKDTLTMRLKNIVTCGEKVVNFPQKNIILSEYEKLNFQHFYIQPLENKNLVSDIIIGKKFSSIFHDYEIQNYEMQKITEFIFKLEKVGIGFVSSV